MLIGEKLNEARRARGIPQKVLAARLGMKPQTLNKILLGKVNPSFDTVARIAAEIGASIDSLVSRAEMARPDVTREAGPGVEGERLQRWSEVPPEEFIEGDWDYPQTWRGGQTDVREGIPAGDLGTFDDEDETAEVLNPTLRDLQSGRFGVTRVKGRSMEPRLHHGDLVLIDTFDKTPKPHRIMAVYQKGKGSAFGYLHKVNGDWILAKANAAEFPPVPLIGEFMIRGVVKKKLEEDMD